ncbi:hypothetical protein B0H63DRAFT_483743 [Podospora didyma]|uniref:Zn(2)-C6 fungal-type domain-containing protein n=1 Tax=Podospora didyma TaxID=330526 RepID=A0AAE0K8J9_9PEZI|nr:hypothetical protein B0H63DRAFT_483743 [Podospora didyma]
MSRHGLASAFPGFSVYQPALGEALQWLPALGTQELDDMIHAFLPGSASIQEKRAHISMDFFESSRLTGETFKFYPVPVSAPLPSPSTASPASSSALYDSGYGSSFNVSPVISDANSWTQSPASFTPSFDDASRAKSRSPTAKKSSSSSAPASSSRQPLADFAHHPGMRIMTKDGRDVTNSASRGCKTKEQRDHAHLMRIIKACDACKRKKIRCDPSHRKRTASQASPSQAAELKPAKKAKKVTQPPPVAIAQLPLDFNLPTTLETPQTTSSFENSSPGDLEVFWDQFVAFDQETDIFANNYNPAEFDFLMQPQGFSPSSGSSSASPSDFLTPYTPALADGSPTTASDAFATLDPALPYLNPGVAHGTNYVDFNLYSPASDTSLDDDLFVQNDLASSRTHHQSQTNRQQAAQSVFSPEGVLQAHRQQPSISPSSSHHDGGQLEGVKYRYGWSSPAASAECHLQRHANIEEGQSVSSSLQTCSLGFKPSLDPSPDKQTIAVHSSDGKRLASKKTGTGQDGDRPSAGRFGLSLITTQSPAGGSAATGVGGPGQHIPDHAPHHSRPHSSFAYGGIPRLSVGWEVPQVLRGQSNAAITSPMQTQTPETTTPSGEVLAKAATSVAALQSRSGVFTTTLQSVQPSGKQQDNSALALNETVASATISTLPVRRIELGQATTYRASFASVSVVDFFQLVAFGLVACLLASALLSHYIQSENNSFNNTLTITSLSLASLVARLISSLTRAPPVSESIPMPMSTDAVVIPVTAVVVDNVKSKIHAIGQRLQSFRSSVSHQQAIGVPSRLASLGSRASSLVMV